MNLLALTYLSYAGIYFSRKNFAVVKHTLTQDPALGFTAGDINGVETAFLFACVLLACRLLPLVKPRGGNCCTGCQGFP